jgi:hypothetical protein
MILSRLVVKIYYPLSLEDNLTPPPLGKELLPQMGDVSA